MTRLYSSHQTRIRIVSLLFFISSTAILGKMFFIQSFQASNYREKTRLAGITERSIKGHRGQISDRNGQVLAETVKTYTFWVNTYKEVDKETLEYLFSQVLHQPPAIYHQLLSQNKNYIILAQGLLQSQCQPILNQLKDIKGLQCDVSMSRYYPYHNLVSQVVGYVDRDHKGQFGIEHQFNPLLNGKIIRNKLMIFA